MPVKRERRGIECFLVGELTRWPRAVETIAYTFGAFRCTTAACLASPRQGAAAANTLASGSRGPPEIALGPGPGRPLSRDHPREAGHAQHLAAPEAAEPQPKALAEPAPIRVAQPVISLRQRRLGLDAHEILQARID